MRGVKEMRSETGAIQLENRSRGARFESLLKLTLGVKSRQSTVGRSNKNKWSGNQTHPVQMGNRLMMLLSLMFDIRGVVLATSA